MVSIQSVLKNPKTHRLALAQSLRVYVRLGRIDAKVFKTIRGKEPDRSLNRKLRSKLGDVLLQARNVENRTQLGGVANEAYRLVFNNLFEPVPRQGRDFADVVKASTFLGYLAGLYPKRKQRKNR